MADVSFQCPQCNQSLEAPGDMQGQSIECPACNASIQIPRVISSAQTTTTNTPIGRRDSFLRDASEKGKRYNGKRDTEASQKREKDTKTNRRSAALIGGWVCLSFGLGLMLISLLSFFIYAPLLLAAFALCIVAIAQRRVAGGVALLLVTLIVPPCLFLGLGVYRANKVMQEIETSTDSPISQVVEIVEWDVTYKSSRTTGSVQADWRFSLTNNATSRTRGQLWLYGIDKDGFQCYENVYEVYTDIPAQGDLKRIHEIHFEPGEYERIETFKIVWK